MLTPFRLLQTTILTAALTGMALTAPPAPAQATPAAAPQQKTAPSSPTPAPPALPDQDTSQEPTFTLTREVNLVPLVFTVTDKRGHFVTGLQRQNFGLLDDGRPPAAVISFTQQTNLPLRLGIMLDTSSSIRTRFKFEQDSALDFFLQVLHSQDRAFVEGFDITVDLTQDYTSNIDSLNEGIRRLRPGGGTALFDSLYKTCQAQMLTLRPDTPVRKAIILVSDGDDNYSRALESDAIKMCQRAETIVYTISTDTSPTRGKGGDVLQTIADATGGRAFFPDRLEDMAVNFKDIEEELRSQYLLEYRPAEFKADGSFRTIYLQATNARYHVRCRTGYFAPKPAVPLSHAPSGASAQRNPLPGSVGLNEATVASAAKPSGWFARHFATRKPSTAPTASASSPSS
jgi:VWFA-related protein